MNKLIVRLAGLWVGIGLIAGVYYRALTHSRGFSGATQLSVVHTHSLALGAGVALALLVLNYVFALEGKRSFRWALWLTQSGVALSVATMALRGTWQITGGAWEAAWLTGVSGLGHTLVAAGFVALAISMKGAVQVPRTAQVTA